jgi:hypothetical protein
MTSVETAITSARNCRLLKNRTARLERSRITRKLHKVSAQTEPRPVSKDYLVYPLIQVIASKT